jgi:Protein of unknown function (DUF3102)
VNAHINPADAEVNGDTSPTIDEEFLAGHAAAIRQLGRQTVDNVIEIGRRLTEVNERIEHGQWGLWLRREFDWAETTARRFIQVYELAETKSANLADLNLPISGLYLLAAPSAPSEVRDDIFNRAAEGEKIRHKDIADAVKDARKPPSAPRAPTPPAAPPPLPLPSNKQNGGASMIVDSQVEQAADHFSDFAGDRRARERGVITTLVTFARFCTRHGTACTEQEQFSSLLICVASALVDGETMGFLDREPETSPTGKQEEPSEEEEVTEQFVSTRRKRTKSEPRTLPIGEAVDEAFTEFEELGLEMRDWADNTPESLQQTEKYETISNTAETLEGIERPDVLETLDNITITITDPPRRRRGYSRAARFEQACAVLETCISTLKQAEGEEAAELASSLQDSLNEAEGVEFPGMCG